CTLEEGDASLPAAAALHLSSPLGERKGPSRSDGKVRGSGSARVSPASIEPSGSSPSPNLSPRGEEWERCREEGGFPSAALRGGRQPCALRLGFRQVKGFAEADAVKLVAARGVGYGEPRGLWRRAGLGVGALERLAQADAFRSLGHDRRQALWAV